MNGKTENMSKFINQEGCLSLDEHFTMYHNITITSIIDWLSANTKITALSVSWNKKEIGDVETKALALSVNTTKLFAAGNNIGNEGAKSLAQNTSVTLLDLQKNLIGDEGAQALALIKTM